MILAENIHKMNDKYSNTIDTLKIAGANIGAVSISLSDVESYLRIISLCAAIIYTLFKLYKEANK